MNNIAIMEMGYVGLPFALQFVHAGYRVFGLDIGARRIELHNAR